MREVLSEYGFDGENTPIISGSALYALEDKEPAMGRETVVKLLKAVDEHIPTPDRELNKPFLLPVEDVFSIPGRGTVVTGRIQRGTIKIGDEVELVGHKSKAKTIITGKLNGLKKKCNYMCMIKSVETSSAGTDFLFKKFHLKFDGNYLYIFICIYNICVCIYNIYVCVHILGNLNEKQIYATF